MESIKKMMAGGEGENESCEVRAQAKLILVLASRTLYRLFVNSFVTVDNSMLIITPAGHLVACDSCFVFFFFFFFYSSQIQQLQHK